MIYFFGDSFIGIFSLLRNKNYRINKYKGGTAKGLTKLDNENRLHIEKLVKENKPSCAIFNFGTVDTFFTIYHKIFIQGQIEPINKYYSDTAKGYIKFIESLNIKNVVIILPGYNPVSDDNALMSLKNYGILPMSYIVDKKYNEIFSRKTRNEFVDTFNKYVKKFANPNIQIIDVNKIIAEKTGEIKSDFVDISYLNIHYRWEPLIKKLIKKITLPLCIINENHLQNLDVEEKKYLKYKREKLSARNFKPRK